MSVSVFVRLFIFVTDSPVHPPPGSRDPLVFSPPWCFDSPRCIHHWEVLTLRGEYTENRPKGAQTKCPEINVCRDETSVETKRPSDKTSVGTKRPSDKMSGGPNIRGDKMSGEKTSVWVIFNRALLGKYTHTLSVRGGGKHAVLNTKVLYIYQKSLL